jgi:hypothetical protein
VTSDEDGLLGSGTDGLLVALQLIAPSQPDRIEAVACDRFLLAVTVRPRRCLVVDVLRGCSAGQRFASGTSSNRESRPAADLTLSASELPDQTDLSIE